jgi:hypothetical protein
MAKIVVKKLSDKNVYELAQEVIASSNCGRKDVLLGFERVTDYDLFTGANLSKRDAMIEAPLDRLEVLVSKELDYVPLSREVGNINSEYGKVEFRWRS